MLARGSILSMYPIIFAVHGYSALLSNGYKVEHCQSALLKLLTNPLEAVQVAVFDAAKYYAEEHREFYWVLIDVSLRQCLVPNLLLPSHYTVAVEAGEAEFKQALLTKAEAALSSNAKVELPTIPLTWVKLEESKDAEDDPHRPPYRRDETVFLSHLASKLFFHAPLEPILSQPSRRQQFLVLITQLLNWTEDSVTPPFADSHRSIDVHPPFEWVFEFSAWCGRIGAHLTAVEVREHILDPIYALKNETALLIMQGLTRSFMMEALLKQPTVADDNRALWSQITDWIFRIRNRDPDEDQEHLDREFTACAFAVRCFAQHPTSHHRFAALTSDGRIWVHLSRFSWSGQFGSSGRIGSCSGLLPLCLIGEDLTFCQSALGWLAEICKKKKNDQNFWARNGDHTVDLLRRLISEKEKILSPTHRNLITFVADVMVDNGVRGAGFLQQEMLRRST